MVRLKDIDTVVIVRHPIQFQFHYGTIKRLEVTGYTIGGEEFQFHYGTIKRLNRELLVSSQVYNFNSTMVRLKEGETELLYSTSVFQFHYGTIKRQQLAQPGMNLQYFNSTMVRLKDQSVVPTNVASAFQFHYGTIKRHYALRCSLQVGISIPLWYD